MAFFMASIITGTVPRSKYSYHCYYYNTVVHAYKFVANCRYNINTKYCALIYNAILVITLCAEINIPYMVYMYNLCFT